MNNTFEFSRFCKVLKKDFRSIIPQFGLALLIIALLPTAVWLFCTVLGRNGPEGIYPTIRYWEIIGVAIIAAMMAPSRMYRTSNLQGKGIYFAMLPASKLEKYLSMIVISLIVCPLVAAAGATVMDLLLRVLPFGPYKQWLWQSDELTAMLGMADEYTTAYYIQLFSSPLLWMVELLSTSALFMFTTTIFKKHKVLKTILWCWLIGFVAQLIFTPLAINCGDRFATWVERMVDAYSPLQIVNFCYWGGNILSVVISVALYWWAGSRLRRMKY